jgi:regulator of replication initiation timing
MEKLIRAFAFLSLVGSISFVEAQETEEEGNSLGALFNKVKDIKVPDSVSNLPTQITELKESYLETTKTLETLRIEVGQLRDEVYMLKKENEELRAAVGVKTKENKITAMLKPIEITASDLVAEFRSDKVAADAKYRDRYLKVVGLISAFETGSSSIEMFLRADGSDSQVRCLLMAGPDFFVDVLPSQGQLISRNDRRPLLSVGQPVAVLGTCLGSGLNVEMGNSRIDGLTEKRIEKKPDSKK